MLFSVKELALVVPHLTPYGIDLCGSRRLLSRCSSRACARRWSLAHVTWNHRRSHSHVSNMRRRGCWLINKIHDHAIIHGILAHRGSKLTRRVTTGGWCVVQSHQLPVLAGSEAWPTMIRPSTTSRECSHFFRAWLRAYSRRA